MITAEEQQPQGRETTFEERATWGTCVQCGAAPGEWCNADVGAQIGVRGDGQRMQRGDGAHLGRLQDAPKRVRVVPS